MEGFCSTIELHPPGQATRQCHCRLAPVNHGGLTLRKAHAQAAFDSTLLDALREAGAPPPIFGFGIAKPEHVAKAMKAGAAGVITGSAIVAAAAEGGDIGRLVAGLKAATRNDPPS